LIQDIDGNIYSVALQEPWGARSTLLKALGDRLCQTVGIKTANSVLLDIGPEILGLATPDLPPTDGDTFFGYRYPVNPFTTAIYDYLPDPLLRKFQNSADCWRLIPIDLWLMNVRPSKILFHRQNSEAVSYLGSVTFRYESLLRDRFLARGACEDLPLLSLSHYGGNSSWSEAETAAAYLLELKAFELLEMLSELCGERRALLAPLIEQVSNDVLANRQELFKNFSRKMRELQLRVDAAVSDCKHPGRAQSSMDTRRALDRTLSAMA
jgi:hypothetical protein